MEVTRLSEAENSAILHGLAQSAGMSQRDNHTSHEQEWNNIPTNMGPGDNSQALLFTLAAGTLQTLAKYYNF